MSQHSEIEKFRVKIYKWDKFLASCIPLLVLTLLAYSIEKNTLILFVGFGTFILIVISIASITIKSFSVAKLIHFFAACGVIVISAFVFPFMRNEYLLMPLTALTVFTTYPFQEQRWNYIIGSFCMLTSVFLFFVEYQQVQSYPEYDFFNQVFSFVILYICIIEIIMTAFIGNTYLQLIQTNTAKLESQKDELEKYIESNLQLENFAHIASHDLKTPLANVIRFSQLLQLKVKGKLTDRENELFKFIIDGSQHMNQTINSLFQFSQATNKKLEYSRFSIHSLVQELKNDIKVNISETQAEVNVKNSINIIYADKILIKQLLLNLILNSLKFRNSETHPVIDIHLTEEPDQWLFRISDNGIGIEEEYREKIFLIFKRLHDNSSFEGTGIGLAICKKIVEQHGGRIWVESELGVGSTFCFTIAKNKLKSREIHLVNNEDKSELEVQRLNPVKTAG